MRSPKSFEAGVPSGAEASWLSWSISIAKPSSHNRIASEATTSTTSHVTFPVSFMALNFATASAPLSSLMIVTPVFAL